MPTEESEVELLAYGADLSWSIGKRRGCPWQQREDLEQEGKLATLEALASWEPGGGASVRSWVYYRVLSRVNSFVRSQRRYWRSTKEEKGHPLQVDTEGLMLLRAILGEREYAVLSGTFGLDGGQWSQKEMARALGCSVATIRRLLKRAKARTGFGRER